MGWRQCSASYIGKRKALDVKLLPLKIPIALSKCLWCVQYVFSGSSVYIFMALAGFRICWSLSALLGIPSFLSLHPMPLLACPSFDALVHVCRNSPQSDRGSWGRTVQLLKAYTIAQEEHTALSRTCLKSYIVMKGFVLFWASSQNVKDFTSSSQL